jgi:hypothetical protein
MTLHMYVRAAILDARNDPAMLQASGAVTTTRRYLEPQSDLTAIIQHKTNSARFPQKEACV